MSMQYCYYEIYGLVIRSNRKINQFVEILQSTIIDSYVIFESSIPRISFLDYLNEQPIYQSRGLAKNQLPYYTVFKQEDNIESYLVIRYNDGANFVYFVCNRDGSMISVFYDQDVLFQDVLTYFSGPIIGCVLRLKNKVCLHASTVNINGKAIAFIGQKTAGKSTLIAKFAELSYSILSDDIAVFNNVDDIPIIHRGYPCLRLWKKSIDNIKGIEIENLTPVLSIIDKYYLPLSLNSGVPWSFNAISLPLGGIYFLNDRNQFNLVKISSMSPLESFIKLKQNIYAEYMLSPNLMRKELEMFGRLGNQDMVMLLDRPDDIASLELVVNKIVKNHN